MNHYRALVTIMPKDGVLDIQGKAVEKTLKSHGYDAVGDVRVGKMVRMMIRAQDEAEARRLADAMASDLLVNDLIESFSVTLEPEK